MNEPRSLDTRRMTNGNKEACRGGVRELLSLGSSTSFLPLPLAGLPYSPSGMRHANAKPDKDCNRQNDGEEVTDVEGTWKCNGQVGKWILIDPEPIEP